MDVSPKTLREVEFREKMRGYHPEDVDQFLERVAAGIEVLQDRLRQAIERAQRAEQAATEAGGNDDALRRTLLLAQRTADLAVQEGREQAARIVAAAEQQAHSTLTESEQRAQTMLSEAEQSVHAMAADAEQRAQSILADSERRAQSMVSEAEHHARRGHEDTLVEVRADLARLEVTRQRLQMDIDAMTSWIGDHRAHLRTALEEALSRVDQITTSPPPATGGPYTPPEAAVPPPTATPAAPAAPAWVGDGDVNADWAPKAPTPAPPPGPGPGPDLSAPAPPPAPPVAVASPPRQEPIAWEGNDVVSDGAEESGDSDPYFAELRRAISDRDPLGESQGGDSQTAAGSGGYAET